MEKIFAGVVIILFLAVLVLTVIVNSLDPKVEECLKYTDETDKQCQVTTSEI